LLKLEERITYCWISHLYAKLFE